MTRDEQRQAWRFYAAAILSADAYEYRDTGLPAVGRLADEMLAAERNRFDAPDPSGDATTQAEPRPWVGLTDAELGVLLADSITEPVVVVVRRIEKMLRAKNGGTR
jgi:hypothetical protein